MIELFKILKGITPNYLSDLFVKADTPYDTRDQYKLIQPLKVIQNGVKPFLNETVKKSCFHIDLKMLKYIWHF